MILELEDDELDLVDEHHANCIRAWNLLMGEEDCNYERGARRAFRLGHFVSALPAHYEEMELPA